MLANSNLPSQTMYQEEHRVCSPSRYQEARITYSRAKERPGTRGGRSVHRLDLELNSAAMPPMQITPESRLDQLEQKLRGMGSTMPVGPHRRLDLLEQQLDSLRPRVAPPMTHPMLMGPERRLDHIEQKLDSLRSTGRPPMPVGNSMTGVDLQYDELLNAHLQLLKAHRELLDSHLKAVHQKVLPQKAVPAPAASPSGLQRLSQQTSNGGKVGIVRLDGANYSAPKYSKKSVLGDAASKATWEREGDKVFYQRPEGYTFTVCKFGFKDPNARVPIFEKEGVIKIKGREGDPNHMFIPNRRGGPKDQPRPRRPTRTEPWIKSGSQIGVQYIYDSETVMSNLKQCVMELVQDCNADCITSACGFMANVQRIVAEVSPIPCLMSSLNLLPIIDLMSAPDSIIIVLTANSESFSDNYSELIRPSWDIPRSRIELVGLQNVEGFGEEVAHGTTVDVDRAEDNIVRAVGKKIVALKPAKVSCILSECTELPGYTNTLRKAFTMPIFDAITAANVLLNGLIPRDEYTNEASYG